MSFLDGITDEDLKLLDQPTFTTGERTEFVVRKVNENVKTMDTGEHKTNVNLMTTILTGPNEGRNYTLYLNQGTGPIGKEKFLKMAVGLFGREAVAKKTAKLSDLVNTRIAAVPGKLREVGDKSFQDFTRFENLGKLPGNL